MFTHNYGYRALYRALRGEKYGVFSGVFFCIPEKTESITDSFVNPLSYV